MTSSGAFVRLVVKNDRGPYRSFFFDDDVTRIQHGFLEDMQVGDLIYFTRAKRGARISYMDKGTDTVTISQRWYWTALCRIKLWWYKRKCKDA